MKHKLFLLAVVAGFILATDVDSSFACGGSDSLTALAEKAVSTNANLASSAIRSLRERGPSGLEALFNAHASLIKAHDDAENLALPLDKLAEWRRLQNALDGVSAQHDCSASRLYWYTNFDDARAAAKKSGKPILSLRLLGNLNEEYSCANSRFFRTTLYPNAEVSEYLREHFVLHWKSVRPVPRITVDFGDGRKIERTITGNSIHYVLDADGDVIDALPGLYGPQAFLKALAEADSAALQYAKLSESKGPAELNILDCGGHPPEIATETPDEFLRQYHKERLAAIQQDWRADMRALGEKESMQPGDVRTASSSKSSAVVTASKFVVEQPMLNSFQNADDGIWTRLAALHSKDAALDKASISLISSKNPTAIQAGFAAISKTRVESPLTSMMRNLQRSIAVDTVRNEYLLHSQIHEWLGNGMKPQNVDQLNSLVYARLFLTPDFDPWLGLVPPNTFTGLDNNGLVDDRSAR